MLKLEVIIASTRPGRIGLPIANWFIDYAREQGIFEISVTDLAELNLPFLDEPLHPRLQKYEHEHTKQWSARVSAADAFVMVIPEYNHVMPPTLLNAVNFLSLEWNYKPVSILSYGGVSAGLRSANSLKPLLTALKMMPIPEAVSIPFAGQMIKDGVLEPNQIMLDAVVMVLKELDKWATALKTIRTTI